MTPKRYAALKLYEDGVAHNEQALKIRANHYTWIAGNKLIQRVHFLHSQITDAGRKALQEYEAKLK
ncbi:hypothetical protein EVB27_123 [Rhizobium phage RHph_TM16]|nr:hypothetical protein EVB27_123 [Rhizobium phage RHph_TM16]